MLMCKQSSYILELLKRCKTIEQVRNVHAQIITRGLLSLHPSSTSLLHKHLLRFFTSLLSPSLSSKSSLVRYAVAVFRLIHNPCTFCYNSIIRVHTLLSFNRDALLFFAQMRQHSVSPDTHTFPFVLKVCSPLQSASLAGTLHGESLKFGFFADVFVRNSLIRLYSSFDHTDYAHRVFDEIPCKDIVSYNVMIDGFVKAGDTRRARELFEQMPERDAVSWGTLLAGYSQANRCREAIELFDRMGALAVRPDNIALVSALSACAQLGELEKGRTIHDYIQRNGIKVDAFLLTGLVDFYAKCGCIETARNIFELNQEKNVYTWNAMLVGLAIHGQGQLLLNYFSRMVEARVEPDGVTFLGMLVGCSHVGLIDEASRFFAEMEDVYGVPRELKHFGCMSDLLGRAGLIGEAADMIEAIPTGGDVFVWGGLLGGCRLHGNVEIAEKAAGQVMGISPDDGGVYSIMADIYANRERWDDLTKIRRLRDSRRVTKNMARSLIQLNGITHEFIAGDDLHPRTHDIYHLVNNFEKHKYETF